MKKGQNWTVDYALSILLFVATLTLISSLLSDIFTERSYDAIVEDAVRVTESLMSPGYPATWDMTDVVRGGLLYEGRLSQRKWELLNSMDAQEFAQALPTSNPFAFTISNKNGTVLGVGENCSVGYLPVSKTANQSNKTLAYYYRTDTSNELLSFATMHNADVYADMQVQPLLDALHKYEVVIFEDPQFERVLNDTYSATLLREDFRKGAQYGPTIILTGRFGTPVLGANITVNITNGTVQAHNDSHFLLNESAMLNFTATYDLGFMPKEGGILGNLDGALHQQPLVQDGTRVQAALWQYEDSLTYYFSDTLGEYDEENWNTILEQGLERLLVSAEYSCVSRPEDVNTQDLVKLERLLVGSGEVYTLNVYMWRNPE